MAHLDPKTRELDVKIVYYGPALSGKTTNVVSLHERLTDPAGPALISVNTSEDRTLFFDLLPLDLGAVRGFRVRFRVFTVPGQVHYAATRRMVLGGADGVVMVLDSAPERGRDNESSFRDLAANLVENHLDPASIPLVVQANKRDLAGALPIASMMAGCPQSSLQPLQAVALNGHGVMEAFTLAVQQTLTHLAARLSLPELAPLALAYRVRLERSQRQKGPGARRIIVRPDGGDDSNESTGSFLAAAVQGVLSTAEEAAARDEERCRAARQRDRMTLLADIARDLTGAPEDGVRAALERALPVVGADGASLLLATAGAELVPRVLVGLTHEPLLSCAGPALAALIEAGTARCVDDLVGDVAFRPVFDGRGPVAGAILIPLCVAGSERAALIFYGRDGSPPLTDEAKEFAYLFGLQIASALEHGAIRKVVEESRRQWLATVDALRDPIYVVDGAYGIVRTNRAFADAVGADPRSLVGRKCHAVILHKDEPCERCFLHRKRGGAVEIRGYLKGRVVEARAVPISHGSGTAHLATLQDVTGRRAIARHLTESAKLAAIGRLASGMAHEINNPLAFIGGNIDFLEQSLASGRPSEDVLAECRTALRESRTGVERVGRIVADLKRHAQADDDERQPTDLWVAARNAVQVAREEAQRPDVAIRMHGGHGVSVDAYPLKLEMAIRALVRNAIEASGPSASVEVTVSSARAACRVLVRDSGMGISPENVGRIFDPFFSTKRIGKHMGLSLSMAYSLTQAMGGTIRVASELGHGATFTLMLPCRAVPGTVAPIASAPTAVTA